MNNEDKVRAIIEKARNDIFDATSGIEFESDSNEYSPISFSSIDEDGETGYFIASLDMMYEE